MSRIVGLQIFELGEFEAPGIAIVINISPIKYLIEIDLSRTQYVY